jgi:hypothetical protein
MFLENKKRTIWSNVVAINDWRDKAETALMEEGNFNFTALDVGRKAFLLNEQHFTHVKTALNIKLETPIVVISELRYNDWKIPACQVIPGNIANCFQMSYGAVIWYLDTHDDLRSVMNHRDGVNYHLFRKFRNDLTPFDYDYFMNLVVDGKSDETTISRYTEEIGPEIEKANCWR